MHCEGSSQSILLCGKQLASVQQDSSPVQAISLSDSTLGSYYPEEISDVHKIYQKKRYQSSGDGVHINMNGLLLNNMLIGRVLCSPGWTWTSDSATPTSQAPQLFLVRWEMIHPMVHMTPQPKFTPGISSNNRKHFKPCYKVCFIYNSSVSPVHHLEL